MVHVDCFPIADHRSQAGVEHFCRTEVKWTLAGSLETPAKTDSGSVQCARFARVENHATGWPWQTKSSITMVGVSRRRTRGSRQLFVDVELGLGVA